MSPLQSGILRITGTRLGSWVMSKTINRVDAAVYRMSRGKYTVSAAIAGVPLIMLTTIGARSGEERTTPLVAIPSGDDLAVIGSNFGRLKQPGWVYNLRANPRATVTYRDRTVPVVARPAHATEYERVFATGNGITSSSFDAYRGRAGGRQFDVFVLESADHA